jgi:two-component system, NarL family, nitrate/nitrite response regulator NarL
MNSSTTNCVQQNSTSPIRARISTVIADNSELYREMLKMILEALPNLEVLGTAGNGCEALELVAAQHPDLALIDLDLSGMNGLQSLALIHEYHPATRVIITAAEDSDELRATCLAQGADGFICKRRLQAELRRGIAEAFSDRGVGSLKEVEHLG